MSGGLPAASQLYTSALKALIRKSKLRNLTGQDWELRMDNRSGYEYYYNTDTRQASWDKPLSVHVSV